MTLPASAFPLRVSGAKITRADNGQAVRLAGVNWGGAYQDNHVPSGLRERPRSEIYDWIAASGFNHVRFPFALGSFVTNAGNLVTAPADPARLAANPDLRGLSPWQVYTTMADEMTAAGLYVVLNKHLSYPGWCCSNADNNGLWYNDNWPSSTFTNTWVMIAQRFAGNPLVGFDLHNEPRPATIGGAVRNPAWGTGGGGSFPVDFRQMYQNTIGRIRSAVSGTGSGITHLVFCEGLSYAGDLTGWAVNPVTGANIVASAHDYPWFHRYADNSPQNWADYSAQNQRKFGYLETRGLAPVWIGECGSNTDASRADFNHGWFPNFRRWASENDSHWCWWTLNATEQKGTEPSTNKVKVSDGQSEGFGLLHGQDWRGEQSDVLSLLASVMP
jgi:hypothetical protein